MTITTRFTSTAMTRIALLTLLALGATAQAQPGPGPHGRGPNAPGVQNAPTPAGPRGPERPFMGRMMMVHRGEGRRGDHEGREGKKHGRKHDFMMGQMLLRPEVRQKFNITDEQVQKIKDLQYNADRRKIELESQAKLAKLDLKRLLQENRPDRAKVLEQVDAVAKAKTELGRLKVETHLSMREVLTDDQINKIKTELQQRKWGRGHGGPGQDQGFGRRMGFGRGFGQDAPAGQAGERMNRIRERMEQRRLGEQAETPAPPAPPTPPAAAPAPATPPQS